MELLKETELISGRKLKIYKGKGKHLFRAQMKSNNAQEIFWALLSELIEIDDKKVIMEDLYEMDLKEVFQIQTAFAEVYGDFLSLPQRQLSGFQNIQDGGSES